MISRSDITVTDDQGATLIEVTVGNKVYGASYRGDLARPHAIKMLVENLMRKEIGIIEHDILMKVWAFEEQKNES